jgi:multidrug efflux pump subunit AcrA (membrane-fusion protein)
MKKKWFIIIGIIVLVGILAVVGTFVFRGNSKKASALQTAQVVRRDIGSTVLATGIIKPMVGAEVKVGSRISGVVKRLRANIGDYVKAGQIIAELDDAELPARFNQNLAALAKRRPISTMREASLSERSRCGRRNSSRPRKQTRPRPR